MGRETADEVEAKTGPAKRSRRSRRFARRVMAVLRGPEPPRPRGVAMVARQESRQPVVVQAAGGVFGFRVYPILTWSSTGLTFELRHAWIYHYRGHVREAIQRTAAPIARGLDPRRSSALETEVNKELDGCTIFRVDDGGASLSCTAQIRVELDERVQKTLQPLWERRFQLEGHHEVELIRADLAEELTKRWLTILDALRANPTAAGAAALTEKQFADVVREVVNEDRDHLKSLIGLLEGTVRNGPGLAAYETSRIIDMLGDMHKKNAVPDPQLTDSAETVWVDEPVDERR